MGVKLKNAIVFAHATSLLATQHWNLSIWLNIKLPRLKKVIIFLLSFFGLISISIPSFSSFCSTIAFYLSLASYASLFVSSLFIPPLILLKTKARVNLLIFYTRATIQKDWKKRKCEGWNGRKGPTFILSGLIKLFPKTTTLFTKHDINSQIPIWVTHCSFLLDSKNALLSKCNIDSLMLFARSPLLDSKNTLSKCNISSLMPFPRSFLLDIILMKGKRCQWMWEDMFYFHPSICIHHINDWLYYERINCWIFWIRNLKNIH